MDLASVDLNVLAALAGGVAYFALGALWYTLLFGKMYRSLRNVTGDAAMPPVSMVLTLVAGLVSAGVIGVVYGWAGGAGLVDGIVVGLLLGVGIVAMEFLKNVVYEDAPWPLYGINASYGVAGYALAGAVYALIA